MNISIALATYNGERYLREQLDSIACQTLLPCEIVVGDDGSTDGTLAVLEAFAAAAPFPVRVTRNPQRLGHEDNFLSIAARCQGDLIAFCDQDDFWQPDKLRHCAAQFADPQVLLVMHAAQIADADLRPIGHDLPAIGETRTAPPLQVNPWDSAPGFALVFSARLIRENDWRDRPEDPLGPGRPLGHDHWVFLMASVLGSTAFLAEKLSLYRRHERNVTSPVKRGLYHRLKLALQTDAASYRRMSRLAAERVTYLQRLAAQANEEQAGKFRRGAEFYRDFADRLAARAALHSRQTPASERARHFAALVRRNAYRTSLDTGGFGTRALVKDAAAVVLGR